MSFANCNNDAFNSLNDGSKFSDPFLTPSNAFIPKDLKSAMDFSLFLYHLNSNYRRASQRVVAHFVTEIDFTGETGDHKERDELYDYLRDGLDIFGAIMSMGEEWACFSGSTKVPTRDGVFSIKDLVGQTVDVISQDGVYRPAEFKSFGKQRLMKVTLSDGQEFEATPDHKWVVHNVFGKEIRVNTSDLLLGDKIKRTVAERPDKDESYYAGVRHGFVFGNGTLADGGAHSTVSFLGGDEHDVLHYFEGHGVHLLSLEGSLVRVSDLPTYYKALPEHDASASYWYGFVCGLLAANGVVESQGSVSIDQSNSHELDSLVDQLPRLGMASTESIQTLNNVHQVHLLKQFMLPGDFLVSRHRDNFSDDWDIHYTGDQFIDIESLSDTDKEEEVFCCTEMATHTFVVGNGVLTSNCYGNSFWRIFFPFDRYLIDTRNGGYAEYSLSMFGDDAEFDIRSLTYKVTDPRDAAKGSDKRKRVSLPFRDRRSTDLSRIKLCPLDPRQIRLQHSWISKKTRVVYQFEAWFLSQIREGRLHQVNETPIDMLKAIQNDEDFLFDEDSVFHCKAPTISGISNNGWGIPEPILNYRSLHQLQVYRKIDESIGLDHMQPFRLFSPNLGGSIGDTTIYQHLGVWADNIGRLIGNRRKDPSKMHAFPFPVNYQEFGADGKSLSPKDLIEFQTNDMLDGMGYPAELFRGSLSVQQIPTALRLFENTFHFLHRNFDQFLSWVTRRTLDYLNREQIGVSLQLPSIANDLEERHIYLQLAAGGEISRGKAYSPFNIKDPVQEAKERMQEDIEIEREKQKIQADFQREQTQGSADQVIAGQMQGQPAGGSGGNTTPLDIMAQAEEQAAQLLQIESDGERSKMLRQIQASNPTLHAVVKQQMETMTGAAASQGRASVGQQLSQGG